MFEKNKKEEKQKDNNKKEDKNQKKKNKNSDWVDELEFFDAIFDEQ